MKFSERWLRTLVDPPLDTAALCDALTMAGLEVEAVESAALPLSGDIAPETDLRQVLALDDALITLKLTPNRPDCLSLLGIARETAAITRTPLSAPAMAPVAIDSRATRGVRIEDEDACPRFASRIIEGIDARAATPAWMKERIERSGIRPISAVVDVTSYVMLELGQPLHAYDARLLDGDVVVRFAHAGEKLTLLNGQVLTLEPDLLLVCDSAKPLGLAGIMGGEHSGIADDTSTVFLEGAFWNPAVIQGKMRRLGFATDAGYRFERGVDFALGPAGVERATQLIVEVCGGRAGPLSDVVGPLPARKPILLRSARATRLLGIALPPDTIADVFTRLALTFTRQGDDFLVTPPSYRFDLAIEEDLIEDVARIHGYDKIPATPGAHLQRMLAAPEGARGLLALRHRLAARDWQEVITFSFVDSAVERALDPQVHPVTVLNPIAAQRDVMRTSLLPGLIETLQTNLRRKLPRVRIFEVGRVFAHGDVTQPVRIGGLAIGPADPEQWGAKTRQVDFYDVKRDLEALAAPVPIATVAQSRPWLHPGRSARITVAGNDAGWIGELHPRLVRHFGLPSAPVVFELDAAALAQVPLPIGHAVSRFPSLRRDIAITVNENIKVQDILDALNQIRSPVVETLDVFDVYRGAELPDGRKSVAILVLMRDTQRTLTDEDGEGVVALLVATLRERFGASLR